MQIRGISAKTFEVRTQAKIIEGRMPTPGLRELVAGQGRGAAVCGAWCRGRRSSSAPRPGTVVGIFIGRRDGLRDLG